MALNNSTAGGPHLKSPHKKLFPAPTVLAPRNLSVEVVVRSERKHPSKHSRDYLEPNECVSTIPVQKIRADLRDDFQAQPKFLAALNLIPKAQAVEIQNARMISPSLKQRLRSRKVVSYFRKNPIPLSSAAGQKIIQKTEIGKCGNPQVEVRKYERNCKLTTGPTKRTSPNASTASKFWPQVNTRWLKQATAAGNHVHKYSRGRKQRVERLSEIVVGLNKESLAALNQCQGFDIRVHRMSDEEIAFKIAEIEGVPQSLPNQQSSSTDPEVTRWISSQPIPGPSSGIETLATPVVKLFDFLVDVPVALKSSKSRKALKKRCNF